MALSVILQPQTLGAPGLAAREEAPSGLTWQLQKLRCNVSSAGSLCAKYLVRFLRSWTNKFELKRFARIYDLLSGNFQHKIQLDAEALGGPWLSVPVPPAVSLLSPWHWIPRKLTRPLEKSSRKVDSEEMPSAKNCRDVSSTSDRRT